MVEEQKTEETTQVTPVADEKPETNGESNGNGADAATNGNGHVEGEANGDEKKTTDNDEGESSGEEELGMLEKPIEILTSKRVRKSVDAYVEPIRQTKDEEFDYSKGPGLKLGDIPFIKNNIDKADTEDLTIIHRMMYRRVGQATKVKRNLREFCGWPFDEDSKEFKSIRSNIIDRMLVTAMKWTLKQFGLDHQKDAEGKDDMEANRTTLIEFMKKPRMIEKEIKRKSTGGEKKSKTPKKKTPAKKNKSKENVSDVSDASDDSSEEEEEKPKKKTPAKKTPKKSSKTPVKIALTKKTGSAKKRKSTGDDDDEDAPLKKKKGNKPPTDAELKKVVSAILKDADLETVTMKNVVKQVYDKYTAFDLSDRKDFIKTTVKNLIS